MRPLELASTLNALIQHELMLSAMIWGPPGIGKSSIVQQTAEAHGLPCIDLRLSQLAPTDLRGLPVARGGIARWAVPEFLPQSGRGVLFLDEINLAPPTMQGMAQQLVLDRRVGSYTVPAGWFIWAAGNRSEDRAAVFEMPAPLANRFVHFDVRPDLDSFRAYALASGLHEQVVAFVAFRPELLHKVDPQQPAWPSPRSWAMASALHRARIDVAAAIGGPAAAEFAAYCALYAELPDIAQVLAGGGRGLPFPSEPSLAHATVVALTSRAADAEQAYNAFRWLAETAPVEWAQLCATELFRAMRRRGAWPALAQRIMGDPTLSAWVREHEQMLNIGEG